MTQRKKFLLLGLGLNLLFYTGVAIAFVAYNYKDSEFFLHTQLRQFLQMEEMMLWEKQKTAIRFLDFYYKNQDKLNDANLVHVAHTVGISAIVRQTPGKDVAVLPGQPHEPVPRAIFDSTVPAMVYHTNGSHVFLTFLITPQLLPTLTDAHTVTIEQPLLPLPSLPSLLNSDITVLENSWQGTQVVRSTMSRPVGEQLRRDFQFDPAQKPAAADDFEARHVHFLTLGLANEKFIAYPMYLINVKDFSQVAVYTFKVRDFQIVTNFVAAVFMLLALCVSTGIVYGAHVLSRDD
jgi:hypothetical protein